MCQSPSTGITFSTQSLMSITVTVFQYVETTKRANTWNIHADILSWLSHFLSNTLSTVLCSPAACLPLSPVDSPGLKAPFVSFQQTLYDVSYATALPGLFSACTACNLSVCLNLCDSVSLRHPALSWSSFLICFHTSLHHFTQKFYQ